MITLLKIVNESIAQALQQLLSNKLRSFLSLLGITIGIFCIIGVQSAVDSLENSIRGSFEKLGRDVIYVAKYPWAGGTEAEYLKWQRRPNASYQDYKTIVRKLKSAEEASFVIFVGAKTLQYGSNSVDRAMVLGATYTYRDMYDLDFEEGRYFSYQEHRYGAPKCLIGHKVATELFGDVSPVGKHLKLMGRKLEVIGLLKKSGKDLVGILDFDERVLLSLEFARKITNIKGNTRSQNTSLAVKAARGVPIEQLKDDVEGILRAERRLKPRQENNFALNELSLMSTLFDAFFGSLSTMGWFIGGFAILVGIFSVANIMFVSVKERTNIIGIKKALGAKKYIILLEFLIESIILCLLGGLFGLLLVYILVEILSGAMEFAMYLSVFNIVSGIAGSVIIGILAGIIPAYQAAGMDPVDAIRSKG